MRYLIMLLLLAGPAQAHTHRSLTVGLPSMQPIRLMVCDTENQALEIIRTQETEGYKAAQKVVRHYGLLRNQRGNSSCGVAQTIITPTRLVYETDLNFPSSRNVHTVVVEFFAFGGTYYGLLPNFYVYTGELL